MNIVLLEKSAKVRSVHLQQSGELREVVLVSFVEGEEHGPLGVFEEVRPHVHLESHPLLSIPFGLHLEDAHCLVFVQECSFLITDTMLEGEVGAAGGSAV